MKTAQDLIIEANQRRAAAYLGDAEAVKDRVDNYIYEAEIYRAEALTSPNPVDYDGIIASAAQTAIAVHEAALHARVAYQDVLAADTPQSAREAVDKIKVCALQATQRAQAVLEMLSAMPGFRNS